MAALSKGLNHQSSQEERRALELNDDEMYQLNTLLDIVGLISVGRKKSDEEANALIKLK
jgi:energy-converting hydrogenase A subunit M